MEKKNDNFIMLPTVDICFKNLMENPEVRRGFISALLGMRPEDIQETTLLPTSLQREYGNDKLGILDILVKLEDGTQIDMEMQVEYYDYWDARVLFYLSRIFASQIKKGDSYDKLKKCIHISILDFNRFPEDEKCCRKIHLRDDENGDKYTDLFEIQILELKKIPQRAQGEADIISWMRFLGGKTREEFEDMAEQNKYIGIAYEELQKLSADELKRLDYESREKAVRDHRSFVRGALRQGLKEGFDKGIKEGREEGRKVGLAEGRAEGRAEGKAEGMELGSRAKLRELTQKKLEKGLLPEEIAELFEEDVEIIRSLAKEINEENR